MDIRCGFCKRRDDALDSLEDADDEDWCYGACEEDGKTHLCCPDCQSIALECWPIVAMTAHDYLTASR